MDRARKLQPWGERDGFDVRLDFNGREVACVWELANGSAAWWLAPNVPAPVFGADPASNHLLSSGILTVGSGLRGQNEARERLVLVPEGEQDEAGTASPAPCRKDAMASVDAELARLGYTDPIRIM